MWHWKTSLLWYVFSKLHSCPCPLCVSISSVSESLHLKPFPQSLHLYGISSVWILTAEFTNMLFAWHFQIGYGLWHNLCHLTCERTLIDILVLNKHVFPCPTRVTQSTQRPLSRCWNNFFLDSVWPQSYSQKPVEGSCCSLLPFRIAQLFLFNHSLVLMLISHEISPNTICLSFLIMNLYTGQTVSIWKQRKKMVAGTQ